MALMTSMPLVVVQIPWLQIRALPMLHQVVMILLLHTGASP